MIGYSRIQKFEENSYRVTDDYMETEEFAAKVFSLRERKAYRPDETKVVGTGAWVLMLDTTPTSPSPVAWGIYWATPCHDSKNFDGYDPSGRYKIEILVTDEAGGIQTVACWPYEYLVLKPELFEGLLESDGYILNHLNMPINKTEIDLELIEQGRHLTEDERMIIWSLQLDGLTEHQACEEYFYSRHRPEENPTIWYCPTDECAEFMEEQFGWAKTVGLPLPGR